MQSLGRLFAVAALLAATAAPLRAANNHVSPAGGGDGSAGSPRTVTVVNSTFGGNRVLGSLAYGGAI